MIFPSKAKKNTLFTQSISLPLFFICTLSFAEQTKDTITDNVYLKTQIGFLKIDNNRQQTDSIDSQVSLGNSYGFGLGVNLFENTDLRINYNKLSFDTNDSTIPTIKANNISTDLVHFFAGKKVYVSAGLSQLNLDKKAISLNIGNGINYKINQHLSWFIESRLGFNLADNYTEFSINSGFSFNFNFNFNFSSKNKTVKKSTKTIISKQVIETKITPTKLPFIPAISPKTDARPVNNIVKSGYLSFEDVSTEEFCRQLKTIFSGTKQQVYFPSNKTVIAPLFYQEIDNLAKVLKRYPNSRVVISGHSSKIGTKTKNLALSQARANAVADYLKTKHALTNNRFIINSYGEEQLINQLNTNEAHDLNRRVEYYLIN